MSQSYFFFITDLSYLLLLPESNMFMEWLSCGDLLDRGRIRMSADTCLGVLDRLSIGELSLLDSVLESGRKISVQKCIYYTHTH